ncbi:MAG TPA: low molecular weight protein arginine phosphatase [Gemmatimonadaceae bacterium]|nr:low molecular weight protein arginine phosphatase [Gemmatimonadaceae bacterium]
MKVLFVCSGNTCRSPLAEAMARKLGAERGLSGVTFGSAGTGAVSGAAASEGSMLVGVERGLDLSTHRSRALTREIVAENDLILGMSDQHVEHAVELGGEGKTFLLDDFATSGQSRDWVTDPFGQDLMAYRSSADDIERQVALAVIRIASRGLPP